MTPSQAQALQRAVDTLARTAYETGQTVVTQPNGPEHVKNKRLLDAAVERVRRKIREATE